MHTEAIIQSMTAAERQNPKLLNGSRRLRIAKGSGMTATDVNSLVQRFEQAAKMMKTVGVPRAACRRYPEWGRSPVPVADTPSQEAGREGEGIRCSGNRQGERPKPWASCLLGRRLSGSGFRPRRGSAGSSTGGATSAEEMEQLQQMLGAPALGVMQLPVDGWHAVLATVSCLSRSPVSRALGS